MSRVTMTHPELPDQPIHVDERAIPHYQQSGWEVFEDQPTTTPKVPARRQTKKQEKD
ncbi:hypothetical protein ACWDWT_30940 [Streptomyces sp. NPDC003343]